MRKLYLLLSLLFLSNINAQDLDAFITTWEVTNQSGLGITIPIVQDDTNSYTVDFGDGTILTNQTGNVTHTYSSAGVYTVTITGTFHRIVFVLEYNSSTLSNAKKIKTIEQWGTNQWSSMESAFARCEKLTINATDAPDLSQVTDMSYMFLQCKSLNQNLNNWDVSNVTNMERLFNTAAIFNQPLDNWDVSNVTNMASMFSQARKFNQPLDSWNVSSVTNMSMMFYSAEKFNQPLNNWDVSSVTNMMRMFSVTHDFDQPLDSWDVSNATNMVGTFGHALSFNQSLNDWDVSNVTDMNNMFFGAVAFNQPLNNWDASNVTDMSNMFRQTTNFNQSLNDWDVSSVTNMAGMFAYTQSFNQPLNNWDVSNVTNFGGMFKAAPFNQPIDNWDVSNAVSLGGMFEETFSFNQPLNNWNVSNAANMMLMFANTQSFNQPLDNWDVSNVTNMVGMFNLATNFNQDISNWNFNEDVFFGAIYPHPAIPYIGFVEFSGLSVENYDLLLAQFVNLELQNKELKASGLYYCDIETRNYLIDELGWTIVEDTPFYNCENSSVSVHNLNDLISVYPNPTNGILNISSKGNTILEEVKIYNLQGREFFGSVQNLEIINIEDLSAGIYLMNIKTNQGSVSKRVIKK